MWPMLLLGGASLLSSVIGGSAQQDAANTQAAASQAGIDETRRQFDAMQKLLEPYTQTGSSALGGQADLAGLNGADAQNAAIGGIANGPEMAAQIQQGENAILQNASATGGLRGGNTQGALAQFRPQVLSNLINQQYSRLGGLAQLGQASAAGVGAAGMQTGQNVAGLLGQQGAAVAGGQLAQGQAYAAPLNTLASTLGMGMAMGKF